MLTKSWGYYLSTKIRLHEPLSWLTILNQYQPLLTIDREPWFYDKYWPFWNMSHCNHYQTLLTTIHHSQPTVLAWNISRVWNHWSVCSSPWQDMFEMDELPQTHLFPYGSKTMHQLWTHLCAWWTWKNTSKVVSLFANSFAMMRRPYVHAWMHCYWKIMRNDWAGLLFVRFASLPIVRQAFSSLTCPYLMVICIWRPVCILLFTLDCMDTRLLVHSLLVTYLIILAKCHPESQETQSAELPKNRIVAMS